jgi:CubicO group peptidase (beta-lactamase class C family)
MSAEIREVYQSNNLHYIMIDSIVAATTGVPFVDYVKEHILDPVGLKDTMYNHTAAAETGRRTHTFAHVGVNKTECALRSHFGNDLFLHKSCRGSIHSYGWWTPTDGIAEAGCGGLVSSIQDVVSRSPGDFI